MRRIASTLILSLLLAWPFGSVGATQGWLAPTSGVPPFTHYPLETMGAAETATVMIEDAQGRLLAGADGLCVFDGAQWARYAFGDGYQMISALGRARDGRILCGGLNELGFYETLADGAFRYHSLTPFLPPDHRDINVVWGCAQIGADLVYFAREKILRWDGDRFEVQVFPTATRLFPVRVGDEWWFTHMETGLYRWTRQEPERLFTSEQLPQRAAMWIERAGDRLLVASSNGLFFAGAPEHSLWGATAREFLESTSISGVSRLAGGGFLVTTLSGIALISPEGELVRVLDEGAGLPGQLVNMLHVDAHGTAWAAANQKGVYRFDFKGAESLFHRFGAMEAPAVWDLALTPRGLAAGTERGLFLLSADAPLAGFVRESKTAHAVLSVSALGENGFLIGRHGGAWRLENGSEQPLYTQKATMFLQAFASRNGEIYLQHSGVVTRVRLTEEVRWESEQVLNPKEYARSISEEATGRFWVATARDGLFHFDATSRDFQPIAGPEVGEPHTVLAPLPQGGGFAFVGSRLHRLSAVGLLPTARRIAELPFAHAVRAMPNAEGNRIYVIFTRQSPAGRRTFGFGRVELDGSGGLRTWTELETAGLEKIGTPRAAALEEMRGNELIWIGGNRGVLRLEPALLLPVASPERPRVQLFAGTTPIAPDAVRHFPYADHQLRFAVFQPELARREHLWFQTRLGNVTAPWSEPTQATSFDFARLSEGAYTFAVRTVDAGGRTSEPVAIAFNILPPWWRSGWAMVGYAGGGVLGVLGFVFYRDRRTRRRTAELKRLVEERTADLKKANAAKDEFLSSISHELRNPLNGLVGLAAGISPDAIPVAERAKFKHLQHCADHLSSMLEDLLDFSKLEAGAVQLKSEVFSLPELVHSVASLAAAESARVRIPIDIAIAPGVPVTVRGDAARIRQVILNFVVNALRYAGRGEVLLTVWANAAGPGISRVTFAVSDDGPGIAPAEQEKLFTRFSRGQAAREKRVGGSGIGLSVCRTLAEHMGGRVWVESEPGHGAAFHFSVPLPVAEGLTEVPTISTSTRLHVLAVDDEEYNLLALSGLLEPLGFTLTLAGNGAAAVAALAGSTTFDAVLLDFDLPDMTGPELARRIRADARLSPSLPVLATTAFVTPDKHAECIAAGMNAVLTKPLTREKILRGLAAASAPWRSAAPVSYYEPLATPDPLAALRLLAERKGVTLADELRVFGDELAAEFAKLTAEIPARRGGEAARSAHKLAGRLGFVQATAEIAMLQKLERELVIGAWTDAEATHAALQAALPGLMTRLNSAAPTAPAG